MNVGNSKRIEVVLRPPEPELVSRLEMHELRSCLSLCVVEANKTLEKSVHSRYDVFAVNAIMIYES